MKKIVFCICCLMLVHCPGKAAADAMLPVDLLKQDIYVARGFSPEWTGGVPEGQPWKKIPRSDNRRIRLSIPELAIEGFPRRKWLSLERHRPETATVIIPFRLDPAEERNTMYGFYFAYIGGCWEIYLNGELIKSEMHLDEKGDIDYITNSRNIVVPVPPGILKGGENILAIRIHGDPTFVKTGVYQNWPNILDDIDSVYAMRSETISLVLIGVYCCIGIYFLFLFALMPSERYTLYFGLLCIALVVNQFARTGEVYSLITDTTIINRVELVFLYALLPLLGIFTATVLLRKITRFIYVYSSVFLVFALLTVVAPMPFVYDLVQFWEKFMALPCLCYIVFIVVKDFKRSIGEINPRLSPNNAFVLFKALKGMIFTTSGRFLFGLIIIAACVILDIILKRYFYMHLNPSRYSFLILVAGTTLNLTDNFLYVHRQVESLNNSLHEKIDALNAAYEKISVSEEKYRMLVERANHYIFTTDTEGNLLAANNKLVQEQKLDPGAIKGVNIMDLIYVPPDDNGVTRRFILGKIDETVSEKRQVSFKATLKPNYLREPREMSFYLEMVNTGAAREIMVKAYDTTEDSLLRNMVAESQVMEMGNYLSVAEEISNRLVRNIERYYDPRKTNILRIALREIILNSIEHGNLDLSYHCKTEALANDSYFEIIAERQKDPRYRERKVAIEYSLTPDKVVYIVKDKGDGFDHRSIIQTALATANEQMLTHGRGIAMALDAFDEVRYNERGNEVTLVKYFMNYKEEP